MADRHLQGPGNPGPESERGEKRGGESEIIFDEERSDDTGEAGNTVGHIDHEGRQIGEPHLTAERENVAINPGAQCIRHRAVRWLRLCRPGRDHP